MKKMKLRSLLLSMLLACLILISACAPAAVNAPNGNEPGTPTAPGTTTPAPAAPDVIEGDAAQLEEGTVFAEEIIVITDGTTLSVADPFNPATSPTASRQMFIMAFDRLVDAVGDGTYTQSLATSWENVNYQTITMTLREGVVFNNGDPFTADDVVATVLAGQDAVGSMAFDVWRNVDSVTAIDTYVVEFVLSDVDVEFFFNLSQPHASIVSSRAIAEMAGNPNVMFTAGTGAFRIVSMSPNDETVFERNDNFWGELPVTQRQVWLTIPEVPTRTIMLLNGEANINWGIPPDDIQMFVEHADFQVVRDYNNNPHYISFNMNDPIAGDINFRRAVAHAIFKPDIAMAAAAANAFPIDSPNLFGHASEFRNNDIAPIAHDMDLARAYLEASVWNGETIELSVAIPTNIRAAEVIQVQLSQLGVDIQLDVLDVPGFTSAVTYSDNRSQIAVYVLPTTLSAAHMRNAFFPGSSLNRASYNNPVVTEMLDRALRTTDLGERRDLYLQIQEIVSEEMPYIPIFGGYITMVATNGFSGIGFSPVGNHDLRFAFQVVEG